MYSQVARVALAARVSTCLTNDSAELALTYQVPSPVSIVRNVEFAHETWSHFRLEHSLTAHAPFAVLAGVDNRRAFLNVSQLVLRSPGSLRSSATTSVHVRNSTQRAYATFTGAGI